MDLAWICLEILTPADAVGYRATEEYGVEQAGEAALEEALSWVDPDCLEESADTGTDIVSGACTTPEGAWVEYEEVREFSADTYGSETTVNTRVEVTPASGDLAWLSVEAEDWSSSSGSNFGGSESWDVAWTGTLRADWPADGAFSARVGHSRDWEGTEGETERWNDGTCVWESSEYASPGDGRYNASVEVSGVEVRVIAGVTCITEFYALGATVDGVDVGLVDSETWAPATPDEDGDGWAAGDGSPDGGDCDDEDPTVYPCAEEIVADGVDQDCHDGDLLDGDGDGYDADFAGGDDCDDSDASVSPGADDIDHDGVDQDCDGADDLDADDDGYDADYAGGDDCDDGDRDVRPHAPEYAHDGVDQDCDGADLLDADGDGHDADFAGGDDCDDEDWDVFPGAEDVCDNGVDEDCDGADCVGEDTGEAAPPPDEEPASADEGCGGRLAGLLLPFAWLGRRRSTSRARPSR